jgi:SAM-dependent methyltransferase
MNAAVHTETPRPERLNDRAFYERLWSGHSTPLELQLAIHSESRRPLLKLLARHLPASRPSRFLEVGCGTALDSCLLARMRPQARGVAADLSAHATALARRNARELEVTLTALTGDLTRLPFVPASFDLVFSQGVLEHFADPAPAVAEQVRVLRPGGVLVVDVPQKFNWYTVRKRRAMRAGRWPWGWETEYSVRQLRSWAGQFGLAACGACGHQHGRLLDRLVIHPHRTVRNKLRARHGGNGHCAARGRYTPGPLARAWEDGWDWVDSQFGPYLAINVAVAFRKGGG